MKYIYIIFFLLPSKWIFAQSQIADIFLKNTVNIKYNNGSNASGVIILDSLEMILVTAKHCIMDKNKNLVDTKLSLIYYPNSQINSAPDTLFINLEDLIANKNIYVHNKYDIGIIKLACVGSFKDGKIYFNYNKGVKKLSKYPPTPVTFANIFKLSKTRLGEECLIFGFPSSLSNQSSQEQFNFNRPLLRKGIIAGIDPEKGTIIVDAPVYQGNSGGPVIQVPNVLGEKIGLIGIVSSTIVHQINNYDQYFNTITSINITNSGYSVIIPIEYALDLLNLSRMK